MNTLEPSPVNNVCAPELSPRLAAMKQRIRAGEHHRYRSTQVVNVQPECDAEGLSWTRRAARLTHRMCEAQTVVIGPDERIVFTRTVRQSDPLFTEEKLRALTAGRTLHELGPSATSVRIGAWFFPRDYWAGNRSLSPHARASPPILRPWNFWTLPLKRWMPSWTWRCAMRPRPGS